MTFIYEHQGKIDYYEALRAKHRRDDFHWLLQPCSVCDMFASVIMKLYMCSKTSLIFEPHELEKTYANAPAPPPEAIITTKEQAQAALAGGLISEALYLAIVEKL